MFKDRDKDFIMFDRGNPRACKTCVLQHGEPPWADDPYKANCVAYPREGGIDKPAGVRYDGEDCPYYVKAL